MGLSHLARAACAAIRHTRSAGTFGIVERLLNLVRACCGILAKEKAGQGLAGVESLVAY